MGNKVTNFILDGQFTTRAIGDNPQQACEDYYLECKEHAKQHQACPFEAFKNALEEPANADIKKTLDDLDVILPMNEEELFNGDEQFFSSLSNDQAKALLKAQEDIKARALAAISAGAGQ